jgi:hypothetical protein
VGDKAREVFMVLDINKFELTVTDGGEVAADIEQAILRDLCADSDPKISELSLAWFSEYDSPWSSETILKKSKRQLFYNY